MKLAARVGLVLRAGDLEERITELEREFRPELQPTDENDGGAFRVESLYSRTEYISGLPIFQYVVIRSREAWS